MGRRAQGFVVRRVGGIWTVRFRVQGTRHDFSTGVKVESGQQAPSDAALRSAEQIYVAALQGKRIVRATTARNLAAGTPDQALGAWLGEIAVRGVTRKQYENYAVQWLREWGNAFPSESEIATYVRRRLREVTRKSVVNELSALRNFSTWGVEAGDLGDPLVIPKIPKSTLGTPFRTRRRTRAPELSAAEVEALISALPEVSGMAGTQRGDRFPVRDRFIVMWDTTLRPETLDRLSTPEHWSPGETVLRITAEIDKEGAAREIPLSPRALAAVKRVAPAAGPIFGAHRYDRFLRAAASAVLPASKAAIFTGQHIRSAAITRALERTANLPGVMHLAGHTQAGTTSGYARPSFRAALAVVRGLSEDD
jgi:integrase